MKERGLTKIPGKSWIVIQEEDGGGGGNYTQHVFVVDDHYHPEREAIFRLLTELIQKIKQAGYVPKTQSILHDFKTEQEKENHLCGHSEKLAIAYGLLKTPEGKTLKVYQNIRRSG
jgi:hypothetical protein